MDILKSIKNNKVKKFKQLLKLKNISIKEETDILEAVIFYDNREILLFLLKHPKYLYIDFSYLIKHTIRLKRTKLFSLTLDYIEDEYFDVFNSNFVFQTLEKESFKCTKTLLLHENFNGRTLNMETLRIAAFKNDDFSFCFILNNLMDNKKEDLEQLFIICIKNQNKKYIDMIYERFTNINLNVSFIFNHFKIVNNKNMQNNLDFMVENLDLSTMDNKLLKTYINQDILDWKQIIKNKPIQCSLTEKWINENCDTEKNKNELKKIVYQNKIITF
jgi:hypothetical protein